MPAWTAGTTSTCGSSRRTRPRATRSAPDELQELRFEYRGIRRLDQPIEQITLSVRGPRLGLESVELLEVPLEQHLPAPDRPRLVLGSLHRQEESLRQAMAAATAADQASIQRSQDVLIATFKSDMFFDFNSATIKPGAYAEIDRVAKVLAEYPQTMVEIQGHTDSSGPEEYNQTLSERRAQAVSSALMQRGVATERMTAIGFGESQPISSSAATNRRVTMVLTPIRAKG